MNKIYFEDASMRVMEKYLDVSVQRQSLISSNLANVDTPRYKTVDLNFQNELESAISPDGQTLTVTLTVTNSRHIPLPAKDDQVVSSEEVEGLTARNDLNNVNVDREMAHLSTNALNFSMVAQFIAGKFRTLKSVIMEGN